jgi:hypothetical protein
MISEPMVHLAQTVHLSCSNTNNISKWTEVRFQMTHVTSEFHRVRLKWFLSLMVHSAQTVYLSCVKISTISKWTRTSFHLTLIAQEYHRVRRKWFLSLWYVWRKLCNYLAPTLTLYPNKPKRDSTWPTSTGVPLGAYKMISETCGMFGANRAPILR